MTKIRPTLPWSLYVTVGTSVSIMYFGGGTRIWVTALMAMIGMFSRASSSANSRPCLEWTRLWTARRTLRGRESTRVLTARSVCELIVRGLGKDQASPVRLMIVMSSERKALPSGCSCRRRRMVPVLPVSVCADSMTVWSPSWTVAECSSM